MDHQQNAWKECSVPSHTHRHSPLAKPACATLFPSRLGDDGACPRGRAVLGDRTGGRRAERCRAGWGVREGLRALKGTQPGLLLCRLPGDMGSTYVILSGCLWQHPQHDDVTGLLLLLLLLLLLHLLPVLGPIVLVPIVAVSGEAWRASRAVPVPPPPPTLSLGARGGLVGILANRMR